MAGLDPRAAVLAGVGAVAPRGAGPGEGVEAWRLIVEAARAAGADAGAPGLLAGLDVVALTQGSWQLPQAARLVATELGARRAHTVVAEVGVPQQTLVNWAIESVVRGEAEAVLVAGGEAKRRELSARSAGVPLDDTVPDPTTVADERLAPEGELVAPPEIAAHAWEPVVQYALIDNALRAAEGRSVGEHRDEVAALWAEFSSVAATNPAAAFGLPARDAAFIREPAEDNRPLAFPYNKWHAAQWSVDQAAALVICSAGAARAHGLDPQRCVHPLVALESSHALSLSRRAAPHRWPAMAVLGGAAERALGLPLRTVSYVELYSCFPAAVRVQQRELGLGSGVVPTQTGGMSFAGGPFNNFTFQATAAMVERLRGHPGSLGLLTTVSGLLTKPGLVVWSTEPGPDGGIPVVADLAAEAAGRTAEVPIVDAHHGPAAVVSATVTYDNGAPARAVAILRTASGAHCVAGCDDPTVAAAFTRDETAGLRVEVRGRAFTC